MISEIRHEFAALPGRMHALVNETEDLKVVLYQLTKSVRTVVSAAILNPRSRRF